MCIYSEKSCKCSISCEQMYQTCQFVEVMHIYFHGRVYILLHFPQFLLVRPEGVVIVYGKGKGGVGTNKVLPL